MSSMIPRATVLFSAWLGAALTGVPAGASAPVGWEHQLSDVMVRQMVALAREPADVSLLIASGRTALQLGNANAAAGFFGRACELAPRDASAHFGMASTLVVLDRPVAAFAEFKRAKQLGLSPSAIASDLGLAYDLAGNQVKAQAAYRSGLNGPDAVEARRRLALSLAIVGDRPAAAAVLQPLLAAGDSAAQRTRAFILALSGDVAGSTAALNDITHGRGSAAEPFLSALPALSAGEKAAALNLGIFPTRIAVLSAGPVADQYSRETVSTDMPGAVTRPMEYGGAVKPRSPSTPDQLRKAELSLYGVFVDFPSTARSNSLP